VYVDRGAGWEALAGPAIEDLSFTALAFDENDLPHFTANRVVGDGFEGLIFRLVRGQFEALPIERLSGGWSRLQAIGFDVVGHGWVAGGRAPDDPYLAGNLSGRWVETSAEAEIEGETPPPGEEEETGGELYAVDVFERFAGLAVGQAEESGPEGYVEYLPRILQLFPRPVGEIDLRGDPVAPLR
jgi:hypothetical protein